MKKTLTIYAVILLGVYVILTFVDSSNYKVERNLWRINKQFDEIAADPSVVPGQRFDDVAQQYLKVADKFPSSEITPRIFLQVGRLYGLKKDFAQAREHFYYIIKNYPELTDLKAEALYNVGLAYELEGLTPKAVEIFKQTYTDYPKTDIGQNAPLYIADLYTRQNKKAEAAEALRQAATYYKAQIKNSPKSTLTFNSQRLLTTTYFAQQDWDKAIQNLGTVLLEYPEPEYLTPQRANLLVKSINTISITKLQDYERPIQIFQEFLSKHPDHALGPYMTEMMKSLNLLKEKNVTVTSEPQKTE